MIMVKQQYPFSQFVGVDASRPGLPPNYVPALMRGSRVKGPLLFWSEGVARMEEQQRAANSAGVW